jgi:hypothetical protein
MQDLVNQMPGTVNQMQDMMQTLLPDEAGICRPHLPGAKAGQGIDQAGRGLRKPDEGQKEITIPRLHAGSAAKGDENGIDCAHHYHYFARRGFPYLAT